MQWDASVHAGFSATRPWLPIADDAATVNVATLDVDPDSLLTLTRQLTSLRRAHAALSEGRYTALAVDDTTLTFARDAAGVRLLVTLNFSGLDVPMPDVVRRGARVLLSTRLDRAAGSDAGETLRADGGLIALGTPPG